MNLENSLSCVFFKEKNIDFSPKNDNTILISLGLNKLDIFLFNREMLNIYNLLPLQQILHIQPFKYHKKEELLILGRVSLTYCENSKPNAIYFCPNGRILNDFKASSLNFLGLNDEDLSYYFNSLELNKLREKSKN